MSMVKELVAFMTPRFALKSLQVRIWTHEGRGALTEVEVGVMPCYAASCLFVPSVNTGVQFLTCLAGMTLDTERVGSEELCRS